MAATSMPDLVDIYDIIIDYAKHYKMADGQKKVDQDFRREDVDLSKLRIHHSAAKHGNVNGDENSEDAGPGATSTIPNNHVLFSSVFTNNTGESQSYSLRTERRTRNTCRINFTRALTVGASFTMNISPPGNLVGASAAFKSDLSVTSTKENTFEEELTWSLDSQVNVRPRCKTRASLVIEEQEYNGQFAVETRLEGQLMIALRSAKDGSALQPIIVPDIRTVFTKSKGFKSAGASAVTFTSVGHIHSRYGITQRVDLDEEPL